MSTAPVVKVSRSPRFPLVWVVPLVALAVGGWMIARELKNRGPEIEIEFADGSGVAPGKTQLHYKGVVVGSVTAVTLKPDLDGVIVRVRLERSAEAVAREGAMFWIVQPEIGVAGIRGLDTLLTGARLNVRPGAGELAKRFVGLERMPPPELPKEGRTFILRSNELGSLKTGSGVYYREMRVGTVETTRMADDATAVLVRIHVEAPYANLVRTNTRFWNAGGFSFKAGLLGAELKSTSLQALLSGGVALATPEGELAPAAEDGAEFPLVREAEKDWQKWAPKIPLSAPEVVSEEQEQPGT
jgi:Paraquat-inducible protein B